MVVIGPQLPFLDALVDANQQVPGYILAVVHTCGVGRQGEEHDKGSEVEEKCLPAHPVSLCELNN